ncbi:MAG: hypothetical protein ACD_58C00227G0001 [uncultured bacterium]|nr:MAG: hypothetical protein ACD_58C00227G0001 [uncultured bacterium]
MAKTILSKNQQLVLTYLSVEKNITDIFCLSGGTALAEYYLQHRLSEDLDFFSEEEVNSQAIFTFYKKIKKDIKLQKIDFQQSFNRNLFFLYFKNDIIKTEFTYYPFPPIAKGKKINNLRIDSLLDIAANKLFTIYQKPRSRDFIDLYLIIKKEKLSINDLVKKAKIKFDWHIDYLQLGSQFIKVLEVKDYPRMIIKLDNKIWQDFFINEAKLLNKNIF